MGKKSIWVHILKPPTWMLRAVVVISLAGLGALAYLGHLSPILTFLDSDTMSYSVGETRVSAYQALKGLLTVIVGFWLAGWLSDRVENKIKRLRRFRARSRALITKFTQILIYVVLFLMMLDIIGVDLTTLGILGGAIGIGIGFGLQKITSNFISGLILLFENSIEVGDLVELPDGLAGFVRHASARYTLIETFDGKEVMVPNEDFVTSRVTNWTYTNSNGRVDIIVGVSYKSDLRLVKQLMLDAANEYPDTLKDPEPVVYIHEFADSSVNFLLYFWLEDVTLGRLGPRSAVMQAIWDKFAENNIEIPFPQRVVHSTQD